MVEPFTVVLKFQLNPPFLADRQQLATTMGELTPDEALNMVRQAVGNDIVFPQVNMVGNRAEVYFNIPAPQNVNAPDLQSVPDLVKDLPIY